MGSRVELDQLLKSIFQSIHGAIPVDEPHIFYQPPESVKLNYPCIIYQRDAIDSEYADDKPYWHKKRYIITIVSRDPDDELPEAIGWIPTSAFDRRYISNNLYHDVFSLFF